MSEFPKESAWAQEERQQEEYRELRIKQLTNQPVDGKVITQRLKEAVAKQAQVSEYEVMEMRAELEMALTALRSGDVGSATSLIQRVHDDLMNLVR